MDESRAARAATFPAGRRTQWLVPGGLLLVLALLTINVLADGPLVGLDQRIRQATAAQANSATWHWIGGRPHAPAMLLVQLGNNQVATPVLLLCALIVAVRRRSVRPLLAAVVGLVLLVATVVPAKILIARASPGLPPVRPGAMGAFPSGHTATSSVCLGLGVLLLAPTLADWARRAAVAVVAALCLLVGAALIWCAYHWFTDVVAGWALAALIVMAALRITGLGGNSGRQRSAVARGSAAAVSSKQTRINTTRQGVKTDD